MLKPPDSSDVLVNSNQSKIYLCEYRYEGIQYSIEIPAKSYEDATARLKYLSQGRVLGEVKAIIPYRIGWIAQLSVKIRNFFLTL
jgi:hypothetical protein